MTKKGLTVAYIRISSFQEIPRLMRPKHLHMNYLIKRAVECVTKRDSAILKACPCILRHGDYKGTTLDRKQYFDMELYSKPHVIEKKKSPRAASNASS